MPEAVQRSAAQLARDERIRVELLASCLIARVKCGHSGGGDGWWCSIQRVARRRRESAFASDAEPRVNRVTSPASGASVLVVM